MAEAVGLESESIEQPDTGADVQGGFDGEQQGDNNN